MYFWKDPDQREEFSKRLAVALQDCEDEVSAAFTRATLRIDAAAARAFKLAERAGTVPPGGVPPQRG